MDNFDEAVSWFQDFDNHIYSYNQTGKARSVLPHSDSKYSEIENAINVLWQGYSKTFPSMMSSVNVDHPPIVLIVEDNTMNAYAVYDGAKKILPYVFIIHTGIAALDYDTKIGVMAHELMHLFAKHLINDKMSQIKSYYLASNYSLGFLAPAQSASLDDSSKKITAASEDYFKVIGLITNPELQGFPFTDSFGSSMLLKLMSKAAASKDPECIGLMKSINSNIPLAQKYLQDWTFELYPEIINLVPNIKSIKDQYRSCLKNQKQSLHALFAESYGMSEESISSLISAHPVFRNFLMDLATDSSVVENLFLNLSSISNDYHIFVSTHQNFFDNLRVYTFEEQADDASVAVLWQLDLNPTALRGLFNSQMTADQRKKCDQYLTSNTEPPYGSIGDPHHGSCFRSYHLKQYQDYLARNCITWNETCVHK